MSTDRFWIRRYASMSGYSYLCYVVISGGMSLQVTFIAADEL